MDFAHWRDSGEVQGAEPPWEGSLGKVSRVKPPRHPKYPREADPHLKMHRIVKLKMMILKIIKAFLRPAPR